MLAYRLRRWANIKTPLVLSVSPLIATDPAGQADCLVYCPSP